MATVQASKTVETSQNARARLILEDSKLLRQTMVLLFYVCQGFPLGLYLYAIPAWMAAAGAGTAQIATVVGISQLPWSLKLVNGFLIDRYTFLPMGRRRAWIIGAQSLLVASLLVSAVVSPLPTDIMLLASLGFAASAATTFQDVAIDSLVIDIMPEEERMRASGTMFGAQILGISLATAAGGFLFSRIGFSGALALLATIPALVLLFGVMMRERAGERRLPWSRGKTHPRCREIQVEAWWPLLRNALRALCAPLSLLLLPILIVRALPHGGFEAFHPVLFTQTLGWRLEDWTGFYSTVLLVSGVFGLLFGGRIVEKIGVQRSLVLTTVGGAASLLAMGLAQPYWGIPGVAVSFVVVSEVWSMIFFIACIPLAMRMCGPATAATQFTIYMAVSNFGRPLGAAIAGVTVGTGHPQWMYWGGALSWLLAVAILVLARFPQENAAEHAAAEVLPQGEGLAPTID